MYSLSIKNVSKTFSNGFKALENISFDIEKGDIFGFLGPNGAGKTTTIRIILGLIKANCGEVVVNGINMKDDKCKALQQMGALVEGPAFYDYLSAVENLQIFAAYSQGVSADRIQEVIKMVGLEGREHDKVKNYSLGMKQRLGIAQAFLSNPSIVILDEPTNGLDPFGINEILLLIKKLSEEQKVTVIISSHILSEIEKICNKVAIINNGKIIKTGSVKELLNVENDIYQIDGQDREAIIRFIQNSNELKLLESEMTEEKIKIDLGVQKPEVTLDEMIRSGLKINYYAPYKLKLEELFFNTIEGDKK